MPLDLTSAYLELKKKNKNFKAFNKELLLELQILNQHVPQVFSLNYSQLITELSTKSNCGAIPSKEYKNGLFIPFSVNFTNFQEMMTWAKKILLNRIVCATDGSQIYTSQEYSIPVALIHVACYRNEHSPDKKYSKETTIKILPPNELLLEDKYQSRKIFSQEPVDCQRFKLETELLTNEMENIRKRSPQIEHSYFLMDGSLILSFIDRFNPKIQETHLQALKKSIDKSMQTNYPLIGYVDSSRAKDIVNMIAVLSKKLKDPINYISDSTILENYLKKNRKINFKLGDRTCTFICDRNDPIYKQYPKILKQRIAFFYIKLNSEQLTRVEFPEHFLGKNNKIDEIANILIAESIIGQGYPHTIDQCHHLAVIHAKEREKFYRLFQKFCKEEKLQFSISNKARSKKRR